MTFVLGRSALQYIELIHELSWSRIFADAQLSYCVKFIGFPVMFSVYFKPLTLGN